MKLSYVILYVENVTETISFYEKAFGFKSKFVTPENDYGELISGETTISFASMKLARSNFKNEITKISNLTNPPGIELAFTSEDLDSEFERAIKAGAKEYEPIKEKPWGQRVGYVLDNNGFLIEMCTPMRK